MFLLSELQTIRIFRSYRVSIKNYDFKVSKFSNFLSYSAVSRLQLSTIIQYESQSVSMSFVTVFFVNQAGCMYVHKRCWQRCRCAQKVPRTNTIESTEFEYVTQVFDKGARVHYVGTRNQRDTSYSIYLSPLFEAMHPRFRIRFICFASSSSVSLIFKTRRAEGIKKPRDTSSLPYNM